MNTNVYTGRETNWTSVVISGLLLIPLIGLLAEVATAAEPSRSQCPTHLRPWRPSAPPTHLSEG